MVFPEYHLADMPPVFDEAEPCRTQCLPQSLVRRAFGMLEHIRLVLSLAGEFRQFHLVLLRKRARPPRRDKVRRALHFFPRRLFLTDNANRCILPTVP